MTMKAMRFLHDRRLQTPCIVLDVDRVQANYELFREILPDARIHYAVKANPARPVLERLVESGSSFDAASWPEIEACLQAGARPWSISFGTTIKKASAIRQAFEAGIRMFAFDSPSELWKIARHAPGASVYCRLAVDNSGASCPLASKFGTDTASAAALMTAARDLDLVPHGLSFHVGSQQRSPTAYGLAIEQAATVFEALAKTGIRLSMLNIGGGFPVRYREAVVPLPEFGQSIRKALASSFGDDIPRILAEPGRAIVADAGVLVSEVVLACSRNADPSARWIYLDVGRFGGLAETENEAIRYRITTNRDGAPDGPVILAGPTCDSMDTLYRASGYRLPLDLRDGDKVVVHSAGAYVSTYASLGFNGFTPPTEFFI